MDSMAWVLTSEMSKGMEIKYRYLAKFYWFKGRLKYHLGVH